VILGGGVAVCLLLSAHRAVIFASAQLSCFLFISYCVATFGDQDDRTSLDTAVRRGARCRTLSVNIDPLRLTRGRRRRRR